MEAKYLDGRYFDLVFKDYLGKIKNPFMVNIYVDNNGQGTPYVESNLVQDKNLFVSNGKSDVYILRLIVQVFATVFNSSVEHMRADAKLVSRHSNLLVIDNRYKKIMRFEPTMGNVFDEQINSVLGADLKQLNSFKGYEFMEIPEHPQTNVPGNDDLCVAYVIKFAMKYIENLPIIFIGYNDMLAFAQEIVNTYGSLPQSGADVEFHGGFGFGGALLGGLAIGGLLGATAIAASRPQTTVIYR
jgi:hypothetical protein